MATKEVIDRVRLGLTANNVVEGKRVLFLPEEVRVLLSELEASEQERARLAEANELTIEHLATVGENYMLTGEELVREQKESESLRTQLAESQAENKRLKTETPCTYPTVIECVDMLTAAGMGSEGKPNTLWAMTKEIIERLSTARLEVWQEAIEVVESYGDSIGNPSENIIQVLKAKATEQSGEKQ